MTSWQFWRRIVRPPNSPIFRRALMPTGPSIPWYVGCAELFAFVLILPLVLFMGPVYGFGWVIGMSSDIAHARENGRFDLLALAPGGPLGAAFAIAVAVLHRDGALERAHGRSTWIGRLLVAALVGYVTLIAPRLTAGEPIIGPLVAGLVFMAALVPDQMQSIALTCAVALVSAEVSPQRATVQWMAFVLLLTFQLGAYGSAISVFLLAAPPPDDDLRLVGAMLAALATLLIVRELLFVLLWQALANRFGAATVLDLVRSDAV